MFFKKIITNFATSVSGLLTREMKQVRLILSLIIIFAFVASCSKNDSEGIAESYSLVGSSTIDSVLYLYIDKHGTLEHHKLVVNAGKFEFHGKTTDVDELMLLDNRGWSTAVFATKGARIELSIDSAHCVTILGDSLNVRFAEIVARLDTLGGNDLKCDLDSICLQYRHTLLSSLVLRERLSLVSDSVFLRQCMGRLGAEAKPAWMVNAIERLFDSQGDHLKRNVRLNPLPVWRTASDSIFDFSESRMNATYIYFWAEHSQLSLDSMKNIVPLAIKYGMHEYFDTWKSLDKSRKPKRVDVLTVCLNAKDSASWLKQIDGLPGEHILLQDGLSNPVLKSWRINKIPYNIIIDRFSNIQDSYRWGKDLQDAIEKMPNNFSVQKNGSNNHNSSTSRH